MPRSKFICDPNCCYHISGKSRNGDWFDVPTSYVWQIFEEELYFIVVAYNIEILSFVLMDNHFHLIAKAPLGNMSHAMRHLMAITSKRIHKLAGRQNQLWKSRFFRSRLSSYHYLMTCYKYVYQNPIRAGVCMHVEEYPFSTIQGILGFQRHIIPTALEDELVLNTENQLNWLNQSVKDEDLKSIRRALHFSEFKLPKKDSRKNRLENILI